MQSYSTRYEQEYFWTPPHPNLKNELVFQVIIYKNVSNSDYVCNYPVEIL